MKLALLPAISQHLARQRRAAQCPPWPRDCWGAALVRLHDARVEKCGVLVCFFKMQKKYCPQDLVANLRCTCVNFPQ